MAWEPEREGCEGLDFPVQAPLVTVEYALDPER